MKQIRSACGPPFSACAALRATYAWGVNGWRGGDWAKPEACGSALEVFWRPAVCQKERDGHQARVLVGGNAGHTDDEHVEVVTDVQFFEQGVQQPARPLEAPCAVSQPTKVLEAVIASPVIELEESAIPVGRARARGSSACGSVAHGRHLRDRKS